MIWPWTERVLYIADATRILKLASGQSDGGGDGYLHAIGDGGPPRMPCCRSLPPSP